MLTRSILEQRAEKLSIPDILKAPSNTQAILYCETLIEMVIFLDTSVLKTLTRNSVDVLIKDVIKVISGLLFFQNNSSKPKEIKTVDGVLTSLRLTRDSFQVASLMFKGDTISQSKSTKFLAELRLAREHVSKALESFDQSEVSNLRIKVGNELLILKGK